MWPFAWPLMSSGAHAGGWAKKASRVVVGRVSEKKQECLLVVRVGA